MNVHPLLVHFPVAMFTVFAFLEFLPEKKIAKYIDINIKYHIGLFLLVVGVAGASAALASGEAIEDSFRALNYIVEVHSAFATATTWIFGALLFAYIFKYIARLQFWTNLQKQFSFLQFVQKLANVLFQRQVRLLLAIIGLISISITGALGGAIAYGPEIDPFVSFVYNLFF